MSSSPPHRAIQWYKRAADQGDKRAAQRLKGPQNAAVVAPGGPGSVLHRNEAGSDAASASGKSGKDKDCVMNLTLNQSQTQTQILGQSGRMNASGLTVAFLNNWP